MYDIMKHEGIVPNYLEKGFFGIIISWPWMLFEQKMYVNNRHTHKKDTVFAN